MWVKGTGWDILEGGGGGEYLGVSCTYVSRRSGMRYFGRRGGGRWFIRVKGGGMRYFGRVEGRELETFKSENIQGCKGIHGMYIVQCTNAKG